MNKKNNIPEYVQAFVPDTEELAFLVSAAKGPNRSMAEFSRACKVKGPSTFSRIVNELIDKPLSDELLIAIAQNAADPGKVTFDMLMRANGKIPKDETSGGIPNSELTNRKLYRSQSEKIKIIKDIIVQHYLDKGCPVMIHPDYLLSEKIPASSYGLTIPSDFVLHIQGRDPLFWNYTVDFTDRTGYSTKSANNDIAKLMVEPMKKYYSLFLRDAWEPESLKDFKNMIIFTEHQAFVMFKILLKDIKVNTPISAMYVNAEEKKIDMEFVLEHK